MTLPALTFECYQLESGVWCKRRANGLRGACVADEAILWQHLQAAQAAPGQNPPPGVDIKELVRENEELNGECERLLQEMERMCSQGNEDVARLHARVVGLEQENEQLRANQRKKPGRKPRSDTAEAEDQAVAVSEQQDPLDEDL